MEGFNTFSNHWILPGKWNEKSNIFVIFVYLIMYIVMIINGRQ